MHIKSEQMKQRDGKEVKESIIQPIFLSNETAQAKMKKNGET
jgi:hypothetical protein